MDFDAFKDTLPVVKNINVFNEVDRYGFSYLLAKRCKLEKPYKSHAAWMHGWFWGDGLPIDILWPYEFISKSPKNMPVVVNNEYQKMRLYEYGFEYVVVGGLPFAYTEHSGLKKKNKSLVFLLPHTGAPLSDVELDFIHYLISKKNEFSEICCCLYANIDEFKNAKIIEICKENGINFVWGSRYDDMFSLIRMRAIFDYFDYMTTPSMGSHILYASFCGCKVFIPDMYYMDSTNMQNLSKREIVLLDKRNVKIWYPWLIQMNESDISSMTAWAEEEIGFNHLLSSELIKNVLGWSFYGKYNAFKRVISRKYSQYFFASIL